MGVSLQEEDSAVAYNDPIGLKEKGNKLFAAGDVAPAIDVWKQALKAALKLSVRHPSIELTQLQTTLRMNLALGFMKEDDYVMAKEHMICVYDNAPHTPKIFYRLAIVYRGLHDERRALDIIKGGLKLFPNDAALIDLQNQIVLSEKSGRSAETEVKIDLSKLSDEREAANLVTEFDMSKVDGMDDDQLIESLIDWRYKSTKPISADEVIEDLDDWQSSLVWRHPYTRERLEDDKSVLYLALPLSILAAVENLLRSNQPRDENLTERKCIQSLHSKELLSLPELHSETSGRNKLIRTEMIQTLGARSRGTGRPFTIHVLGARGDHEMEAKWSAILQRLPYCQKLQVIMVGFLDADDQYNRKLSGNEYLSPPLVKNIGLRQGQKFTARLYKGTYHQFLRSAMVAKETHTDHLKPIVIPLKNSKTFELPNILSYDSHPFYPDLIVLPEPNLSRHFDSWIPSICPILLSNIPMTFLGHSALEMASHEALQIPAVMRRLNAKPIARLLWNPFMIAVQPTDDLPPMPTLTADGREISYKGLSAKFAVVGTYQSTLGLDVEGERSMLAELARGECVDAFRERLRNEAGVDVDRERIARTDLMEDESLKRQVEKQEREREELVELKARAIAERLTCGAKQIDLQMSLKAEGD